MKMWVENQDGEIIIHMTEPKSKDEWGWRSNGTGLTSGFSVCLNHRSLLKAIPKGMLGEFELSTLWEENEII